MSTCLRNRGGSSQGGFELVSASAKTYLHCEWRWLRFTPTQILFESYDFNLERTMREATILDRLYS